jgi:prophage antirepressor-like protein
MILNNKALLCIGLPIQPERLAPVHDNAFLLELAMDMVLKYKDANIRTVEKDGRMLFVLADICGVLGLTNPSMVAKSLENDEKTIEYHKSDLGIKNESGNQNIIMINEAGLYNLIFKSEKPEAKDFKRWVTHDVLPSIRQYGFYIDTSFEMHTKDIAELLLLSHVAVIKQVGNVLPQYWYHCNGVGRNMGLKLNALESFLVIARACRENLKFISEDLPEPVRKIAAGMGVRFDVTFSEYKKMIL